MERVSTLPLEAPGSIDLSAQKGERDPPHEAFLAFDEDDRGLEGMALLKVGAGS